jgi:hypothetical protein
LRSSTPGPRWQPPARPQPRLARAAGVRWPPPRVHIPSAEGCIGPNAGFQPRAPERSQATACQR